MAQIRQIHQIEITSRCNLRCPYCVHPTMARPKVDMAEDVWQAALTAVRHFVAVGTQGELNLAGIGESTLHPRFVEMVHEARLALGWSRPLVFATNGLLLDDSLAKAIAPAQPRVWVSLHRPEKAAHALEALQRYGLLAGVSTDPVTAPNDWAGQVTWRTPPRPVAPCPWLPNGWCAVFADGSIGTCCLDGAGAGVIGHVLRDDVRHMDSKLYALCASCWQYVPPGV